MAAPSCPVIWRVAPEPADTQDLQRSLGCSRIAAVLLTQRGVETEAQAREFLSPSFDALADPTLLPDAVKAVRRLMVALDHHERIYVYGDYDADGITAAALWTRLLQQLGGDVCTQVPHRRRDGYDLRNKVVKAARDAGAKLIVTADCGIQRHEEVQTAKCLGLDVIVTDHHEVGATLPGAVAVVNPHRPDSQYPFRDLAGVGVSYRLAEALVRAVGLPVDKYRRAFSDLAAIGTVTDIMPLLGDNRVFVRTGLHRMSDTQRKGLRALMRVAGIEGRPVTSHDIGFAIGPRLNAVGRVDEPQKALDLLLSRVEDEAVGLAEQLESANQSRKDEEQRILELATGAIAKIDMGKCPCLVLDSPDWHPGVIGVVANRLVERYGRPTVLIATDPDAGVGRGSARSIPSFNIHDALLECGDRFIEFGGHAHAAGFTIPTGNVEGFRDAFIRYAASRLRADEMQPYLDADAEVLLREITRDLLAELASFEPWGHDNEEPLFAAFNVRIIEAWRIGRDGSHLKLRVAQGADKPIDAVMWWAGDRFDFYPRGAYVDICFRARLNRYCGREMPQLQLVDIRMSREGRI